MFLFRHLPHLNTPRVPEATLEGNSLSQAEAKQGFQQRMGARRSRCQAGPLPTLPWDAPLSHGWPAQLRTPVSHERPRAPAGAPLTWPRPLHRTWPSHLPTQEQHRAVGSRGQAAMSTCSWAPDHHLGVLSLPALQGHCQGNGEDRAQ